MSIPSYAVEFRGFWACPCLATWLPVFERELQRRGLINAPLHIYQLIGTYSGSGGTHADGGAFDVLDLPGDEDQWVARQMGADATWARPYNWDGKNGMAHTHGVLSGCPHNGPARYQITAVQDGYNGLGTGGRGGKDTGPRPLSGRTWQQGIAWAQQQAEETDMTPDQAQQLTDTLAIVTRLEARSVRQAQRIAGLIRDVRAKVKDDAVLAKLDEIETELKA